MSNYAVIQSSNNICDNVVVWDDTLGPWAPPAGHYTVDIDGLSVGIGWYYDQATNVWTGPPSITARFSPSPIFLGQTTILLWESQNVETVTIDGQSYAPNDSKEYTPSSAGKFTVVVRASGLAGNVSVSASVVVAATQAELGA